MEGEYKEVEEEGIRRRKRRRSMGIKGSEKDRRDRGREAEGLAGRREFCKGGQVVGECNDRMESCQQPDEERESEGEDVS
eukprot:747000-Hanusia_phi.AAC.1